MTKKKYQILLAIFILELVAMYSCSQVPHGIEAVKKITPQDSMLLKSHLLNAGKFSLFSRERELYIDSALLILPHNAYLWQQKAMPLFKQMKYETGMLYLDSAVKYDKAAYAPYRAFIKCIFQKNYQGSIAEFNALIASGGDNIIMDHPYSFYVSLCWLQKNNFDSALNYINQSVGYDEAHSPSKTIHFLHYFYWGIILYEKGNYQLAMEKLNQAIGVYSNFADAMFYKALCIEKSGQLNLALEEMGRAKKNLLAGYTINEDNAIYERYPYQIKESYITNAMERLSAKIKK